MNESKGFTIKCNECGRETTFIKFEQDNENIGTTINTDGDVNLKCDCGNWACI